MSKIRVIDGLASAGGYIYRVMRAFSPIRFDQRMVHEFATA